MVDAGLVLWSDQRMSFERLCSLSVIVCLLNDQDAESAFKQICMYFLWRKGE